MRRCILCGFCGWLGNDRIKVNGEDNNSVIYNMTDRLYVFGPKKKEYYQEDNVNFGSSVSEACREQIIQKICNGKKYAICFYGNIYNCEELKNEISKYGINNISNSDAEIAVSAYIVWNKKCGEHLRGAFSFCIYNEDKKEIFLIRDHLGVKPLFYAFQKSNCIFATEIKSILEFPGIKAKIDKDGIAQLFGLGPARIVGKCVFKDIFEILPGHYAIVKTVNGKIVFEQELYWQIKNAVHEDNEEETIRKVKLLVDESIKLQSNDNVGAMLSGGLDSSIITGRLAGEFCSVSDLGKLETFSVYYEGNDVNFKANDFQPDSDNRYIDIMKEKFRLNHNLVKIDTDSLIKGLKEAMIARNLPGMADVDVSLLEFCKHIKEKADVVLSGEFADEIFGGYPWFYRKECLESETFPWSLALDVRQKILNKSLDINIQEFVSNVYRDVASKVPMFVEQMDEEEILIRKLMYMNIYYFGATLMDRTERMAKRSGLDVRTPFADYMIVEYVWNIPWKMKTLLEREKGLLRKAYENTLPKEVCFRKKSPYPKTYDPLYIKKLKSILFEILENEKSPILQLINKAEVINIVENLEERFTRPWFGQLMKGPQFIAYLIQINMWLEEYNVKVELGPEEKHDVTPEEKWQNGDTAQSNV